MMSLSPNAIPAGPNAWMLETQASTSLSTRNNAVTFQSPPAFFVTRPRSEELPGWSREKKAGKSNGFVNHSVNTQLRRAFAHLRTLKPGWDGPQSRQPDFDLLAAAAAMLELHLAEAKAGLRLPVIVPCGNGSLQAEWHGPEGSFELYFEVDGDRSAWVYDADLEEEHEFDSSGVDAALQKWIAKLSSALS